MLNTFVINTMNEDAFSAKRVKKWMQEWRLVALLVARRTNDRKVAGSRPTKVVCITVLNVDFPSVLWYCWLGLLTCKNRLPYNLYCVGGDVKHCTIQSSVEWQVTAWGWTAGCGRPPLLPSCRKLEFRLSALMDSDLAWVNGKSVR